MKSQQGAKKGGSGKKGKKGKLGDADAIELPESIQESILGQNNRNMHLQ